MDDPPQLQPCDVSAALEAGALQMHYQPVVALASQHVVGFEALARLWDRRWGLLPPAAFVPVAEHGGRVVELGEAVLRQSIAEAARWRAGTNLISTATVSINVAPAHLQEPGFVESLQALLAEYDVPGSGVIVEITETSVTSVRIRPVLERLAAMGVRVALDDFGVGFATLDNLRRLPVQVLKLDRSFVAGVTRAGADRAIVRVVVDLADALGLSVIAEGVETEEQAEALLLLGCPAAQGFLFARPGPDPQAGGAVVARCGVRDLAAPRDDADDWPVEVETALVAAARLLSTGDDPHRSAVHAVATALARACRLGQGAQRAVGRLALAHDIARLGLDGALPAVLARDWRVAALVGLPGPVPEEVAVVRAAARVVDVAAADDPFVGPEAIASALRLASTRASASQGAEQDRIAVGLASLAAQLPDVVPVSEVVDDLDRRRLGRRATAERLRSLVGVTRVLASSRDSRELLRVALEEVRRIVGAASASLERWERDTAQLRTLVNVGQLAPTEVTYPVDEVYPLADYAQARRTMLTGLPHVYSVDDPDAAPEAIALLKSMHKYSSAAVPVYTEGRMWGQVRLSTDVREPPFTAGDRETLLSVATLMGGVVAEADNLDRVSRLTYQDPLTRIGNRRAAEETLRRLADEQADVALLLFDVDGLKEVNDAEGHARGDELLVELAEVLSAELAHHAGSSVARLGDDEFCVVLTGYQLDEARWTAEQLAKRVAQAPGAPAVSAGVGTAFGSWRPRDLLALADADLRDARRRSRTLT